MPMDFPDMDSLKRAAEVWQFREPEGMETEASYRNALADHVQPKDVIESMEIRSKHGWDKFDPQENRELIRRSSSGWR